MIAPVVDFPGLEQRAVRVTQREADEGAARVLRNRALSDEAYDLGCKLGAVPIVAVLAFGLLATAGCIAAIDYFKAARHFLFSPLVVHKVVDKSPAHKGPRRAVKGPIA